MKTEWDYTNLADAYLKRPDYSAHAIDKALKKSGLKANDAVCDVGAGVGHLTLMLAERGYQVHAVEPNDAMRTNGSRRTKEVKTQGLVTWYEGSGEETGLASHQFNMVTFGSSFNVVDRAKALIEVKRIAVPQGWFACLWNHRDINDPIQKAVEEIISSSVDGYDYGLRREDQTQFLSDSGVFKQLEVIEGKIEHAISVDDWVEAWRSHATLQRQAGEKFPLIINEIENYLRSTVKENLIVPYVTKIWLAQLN